MKRILLIMALAASVLSAASCGKQKQQETQPATAAAQEETDMSKYMPTVQAGDEAPDFEAPDILGNAVKLSDFRGKYVLIDFWATWCKDCRAELPGMQKLYADYAHRGVQFLGVSFDTDKQALLTYGIDNEIAWLNVCNEIKMKENPISVAYGLKWIPTMYLVNPEGKVVGTAFHTDDMDKMIASALGD